MSKRLEDLDLKEVSEKTRIEPEFFEFLLSKDFEELSKFNVKGFFKILKREYGLDLSDELAEYEAFLNKDEIRAEEPEKESKVVTNVEQYSKETSSIWLWAAIVIVLAAIIAIIVKFDFLTNLVSKEDSESQSVQVAQNIDDAQNNMQEVENNESAEIIEPNEANSQSTEPSTAQTTPQVKAQESTQSTQNAPQSINEALNSSELPKKEAIFSTDGKVWVGFIDLSTRTNSSIVTDSNFSVDLSKDQLLLIGGTALTLVDETGEVQNFPAGNSKRFLVKDGKIKSINLSEFMSYNRGKEW